jgi:RHH-type proline utilization regulon transcriptional repressor/proline dehydrogenase/delta 1-pyrroline-5-carboxylate dehydrogenase
MLNAKTLRDPATWQTDIDTLMARLSDHYIVDEDRFVRELIKLLEVDRDDYARIEEDTASLVREVRNMDTAVDTIDELLQQYSLDTHEGLMLMCLAEAMLRIPDKATADALIEDKLGPADWNAHVGKSESWMVNASTWGLLMTGHVLKLDHPHPEDGQPASFINRMVNRMGEPVIRRAMVEAMKIMGKQFVLGRDIDEALKRSKPLFDKGYTYSYDMLGEAARTRGDAQSYFNDYKSAIEQVGKARQKLRDTTPAPSISIKLSALHPRYEFGRREQILTELVDTVTALVKTARELDVEITIDAEEVDRLELSLEVFRAVYESDAAKGWGHFGLVIQAYAKRALPTLHYINRLADQQGDEIPLRLVKGAYWDTEVKESQQLGVEGYPVFTRKACTDVAYLACTQFLLSEATKGRIFPQFATHNAHTVTAILAQANQHGRPFEFQRLHGMGEALYDAALKRAPEGTYCRIYAPVGAHKDLLPYLVRRLLENGANSSFVHQIVDPDVPVKSLCEHPVDTLAAHESFANPRIPLPQDIYGPRRRNSRGVNLNVRSHFYPLMEQMAEFMEKTYTAKPLLAFEVDDDTANTHDVTCPFDRRQRLGSIQWVTQAQTAQALDAAWAAFPDWDATPVAERAAILRRFADLLESHTPELMTLCSREGGKLLTDGVDEIKEAVDFCRYYAMRAEDIFSEAIELPGPTGESNCLQMGGKGVFAAISPWNFPVAIFCGQMVAAAVAGNTVLAKPAEQTSLIAHRVVELLYAAGMPRNAVQLLPGDGKSVGSVLTADPRITGVAFTGGTDTAQIINRALAARENAPLPTLIAETGGMNAMIVDSTALPEQVVVDVIQSAFQSAGQRCSALRVLYLQEDVAERVIEILTGAMQELRVGDPRDLGTDVGPVIDEDAREQLQAHIDTLTAEGRLIAQTPLEAERTQDGTFIAPAAVAIDNIDALSREQFGPILHIVRYKASELDQVIDDINGRGYGLTFGVHSRNASFAAEIAQKIRAGNVYINRNIIGAVVGVQPFGGQGLSGTGPKAGGPNYLLRFASEKTVTNNTAALGGNASLLAMGDS